MSVYSFALSGIVDLTSPGFEAGVDLVLRATMNLVAMSLLTVVLFLPRHRRRDLLTVYWMLNVALF